MIVLLTPLPILSPTFAPKASCSLLLSAVTAMRLGWETIIIVGLPSLSPCSRSIWGTLTVKVQQRRGEERITCGIE